MLQTLVAITTDTKRLQFYVASCGWWIVGLCTKIRLRAELGITIRWYENFTV